MKKYMQTLGRDADYNLIISDDKNKSTLNYK